MQKNKYPADGGKEGEKGERQKLRYNEIIHSMESAGVTLKFLPPLVCVCLPIKAGYKEDHWIQTMFSSVTSAHFHFHMWECVDMKQQSLSVLSIQHEKQFPTDSRTTHDSSCFSFCPDNTACTMTGG